MKTRLAAVAVIVVAAAFLLCDGGPGVEFAAPPAPEDSEIAPPSMPRVDRPIEAPSPEQTPAAPEGSCALHLSLVDGDTGEAASTDVRLWRLGEAGDELAWKGEVSAEGTAIRCLPEGRYRAQCEMQREGTPDPPGFFVSGPETARILTVKLPRTLHFRLMVFDEGGRPITEGTLANGMHSTSQTWFTISKWANPRKRREEHSEGSMQEPIGVASAGANTAPGKPAVAHKGAFDIGEMKERRQTEEMELGRRFSIPGRNTVLATLEADAKGDVLFVALCVPHAVLAANVFLPDGVRALDAGAEVRAVCIALVHQEGSPLARARKAIVHVTVILEGYEPLKYRWRHRTDSDARRILLPKDR